MTKEIIFYLEIIDETLAHATVEGWEESGLIKRNSSEQFRTWATLTEERLFRKLRK